MAALVYGLTLSGNHSETEDSVGFAVRVRDAPAEELVEGTHLVYLVLGRAVYAPARALGLTADPLRTLQVVDLLLGAATVGALWLLLRRAGVARVGAAATAGTAAFSYAFWRNATEAEVYALSALALVGSLAAAWAATRAPRVRTFTVLGVVNGAAVLAHVTNVVFAVVAGAAIYLAARRGADFVRWATAYAVAGASVVVPPYAVAAGMNDVGSPGEFWSWFRERTGQEGDFGTMGLANLARGTFGGGRALVGGHFALSIDPILERVTARFPGKTFTEELFFLRGFSGALAVALLLLAGVAVALLGVLAARWRRPALEPPARTLAILAIAWLVPYALVFLWWDPLNIEFWYAVWLAAAILVGLPTASRGRGAALVASAVGALFLVNLVGSVIPQRDESLDLWRAKASWYRQHARPGDLVVSNGYVWSSYLRYLVRAEILDIEDVFRESGSDREALAELRGRLASGGDRVLVSGEVFHPFADRRVACVDAPRTCAIAALTRRAFRDGCELLGVEEEPFERVWRCRVTG